MTEAWCCSPREHRRVTATGTQVVFDTTEPHVLAAFWAAALHYEHEEIDTFVSDLVESGRVPAEHTVEIDGKRRWRFGGLVAPSR